MILLVSITDTLLGLPSPVPYIWTMRGCAAQCTFCLVHSMIFSLPQTALLYTLEQGLFSPSITITHQMRNSAFPIVLSLYNRQNTLCFVECAILK